MSHPTGSPIQALIDYYERLNADPETAVAEPGFSVQKIYYQVVLERDGKLHGFEDIRERDGRGKAIPRPLLVPDAGGRSGTGMKPFFCWDNTGYALGRDGKGNPARALEMFAAFRDLHLSFRDELAGDEGFSALCRFLERWEPGEAEPLPNWEEGAGLNVVFKLRGRTQYVHQNETVRAAWARRSASPDEGRLLGESLLTGREEEIARLHPLIKGVAGANTTGAAFVSFNSAAFESYGKTQAYNAPVGTRDVHRYTTALNKLLADRARRTRIGDATVVFWSDREEGAEGEEILRQIFGDETPRVDHAEHAKTVDRVRSFLDAARRGVLSDQIKDPDVPFYILGLSPNVSRLSVRYWLAGTVGHFARLLADHAERLRMDGSRADDHPAPIRQLLLETAREPKDIAPQLGGDVARSVLEGLPYPRSLFNAVMRRIRADSAMNHRRASILKAYLVRNRGEEIPVALDKDNPDEAYQLGRFFAALEKTQEDAAETKLNATIKDRFFGSAGAMPATVFPRLLRLNQHHVNKLENPGLRISREKLLGEICGRVRRFPAHLSLEKQGLFYIGYYHQRRDFFTKRGEDAKETSDE